MTSSPLSRCSCPPIILSTFFFFFNDTTTTEIYTLSLHDALPICACAAAGTNAADRSLHPGRPRPAALRTDRKSTRLNSSHMSPSYAVFCLKKQTNAAERAPGRVRNNSVSGRVQPLARGHAAGWIPAALRGRAREDLPFVRALFFF